MPKECPDDKVLNPATGRCVSKDGSIGKKILKGSIPASAPKKDKECPDDKVLNPATGRCVSKNGSIGKKILESNLVPINQEPINQAPINQAPINQAPINQVIPIMSNARGDEFFYDVPEYTPQMYNAARIIQRAVRPRYYDVPEYTPQMNNAARIIQRAVKKYPRYYDVPEYTPQIYNAARIIQRAVKKYPRYYDAPDINEEEEIYYTAPQFTKKEQKEMKRKNKKTKAFISNIDRIKSSPQYMKDFFDKPTSLPGSQVDIIEGIAYINRNFKQQNKPKIKRTNKRSMI